MITSGFNSYQFALRGQPLPEVDDSMAVCYLIGANGVLARSRRPGLEVGLPVGVHFQQLRGLEPVTPYVKWDLPRVPMQLVELMLTVSRACASPEPTEALFYLNHGEPHTSDAIISEGGWNLEAPPQRASREWVEPEETGAGSSTERALIEVHSHHYMRAEFSPGDDTDELGWFRVYGVIGNIFERPELRVRVSLFGHGCEWPASEFFELPTELNDCLKGN
ncbi:MAG TPA: hypothetical protein VF717_09175 [Pyrinomonadaceae bacterium]|jgi:hypothetical protein